MPAAKMISVLASNRDLARYVERSAISHAILFPVWRAWLPHALHLARRRALSRLRTGVALLRSGWRLSR